MAASKVSVQIMVETCRVVCYNISASATVQYISSLISDNPWSSSAWFSRGSAVTSMMQNDQIHDQIHDPSLRCLEYDQILDLQVSLKGELQLLVVWKPMWISSAALAEIIRAKGEKFQRSISVSDLDWNDDESDHTSQAQKSFLTHHS